MNLGLGYAIETPKDEQNRDYPVRKLLRGKSRRQYRYWNDTSKFFNQGQSNACVGHAWAHLRVDGPIKPLVTEIVDPFELYRIAQENDDIPGPHEGSTTLGGAKAAAIKGWLSEYRWAFSMQDVIDTVLDLGPMIVGTWWHYDMFETDKHGFLSVSGGKAGGHEYEINGVSVTDEVFRIKNSWGQKDWGIKGRGWITFKEFEKLLYDDGDACYAVLEV